MSGFSSNGPWGSLNARAAGRVVLKADEFLQHREQLIRVMSFSQDMCCAGMAADVSPQALLDHIAEIASAEYHHRNVLGCRRGTQPCQKILCVAVRHEVVRDDDSRVLTAGKL
jgi:hypothetical protein